MNFLISAQCRAFFFVGLIVFTAAVVFSPDGSPNAPFSLALRMFHVYGLSAEALLLIAVSNRERWLLLAAMFVCALVGLLASGFGDSAVRSIFVGLAAGPFLFLFIAIAVTKGAARSRWVDFLAIAALMVLMGISFPFFLDESARLFHETHDVGVAAFDESFGIQASGVIARAFHAAPRLRDLSVVAYCLVPLPTIVLAAFEWRRGDDNEFTVLPSYFIATTIGFVCYFLAPVLGPKPYFGADFPLLHVTPDYLAHRPLFDFTMTPRNCMPSLHFTWALQLLLYCRTFPRVARCYAAFFAFLTFCATLGFGQHYLTDLIVAAPLVVMVRGICATRLRLSQSSRAQAIVVGFGLLAVWICGVRGAIVFTPSVIPILSALTVFATVACEQGLARAEKKAREGNDRLAAKPTTMQPTLAGNAFVAGMEAG